MSKYFIYYTFNGGRGRCSVTVNGGINNIDDITEIEMNISIQNELSNIMVVNWKRFEND